MVFWRKRREQDLDRELRDHLELEAAEQDRRALGNTARIKEDVREAWGWTWLDRLAQDVRYTARVLRRSPGFTAVAVLSLALGIGANTAIFGLIDAVRLRGLPVPKPEELTRIQVLGGNRGFILRDPSALTYPLFQEIRDHQQAFSGVFAWSSDSFPIGEGMQTRIVPGLLVTGGFFNTLGISASAGRLLTDQDDVPGCAAPGLVLSYGMWQTEFGAQPSAVGSRVSVLGHALEVIGVASPSFSGPEVGKRFDLALPICAQGILTQGARSIARRDIFWLSVMARLKPGWTVAQASQHLQAISPGLMENTLPSGYGSQSIARYRDYRFGSGARPRGRKRSARSVRNAPMVAASNHRYGAADRLHESGESDAGSRRRQAAGTRRKARPGSVARPAVTAGADRKRGARRRGNGRWNRPRPNPHSQHRRAAGKSG